MPSKNPGQRLTAIIASIDAIREFTAVHAGVYSSQSSMSHFWKTRDGRWRRGSLAWVTLLLVSALYDFVREGLGSLTGIQYLLLAVAVVALAPAQDEPQKDRSKWYVLQSPRYAAGAVAYGAAAGILMYRVARDIYHW